ncbi:hypothetical protein [Snodgrassella sp. CFCC 13594]|uniref:XAC2610-related protein n=1 Tax=Snodgrassella sp. CFCC 13594 TaxID=1775559 RepID=UPI00082B4EF1|nr:hypothetical protein [Snodgrassella sp. CFCC 13594]
MMWLRVSHALLILIVGSSSVLFAHHKTWAAASPPSTRLAPAPIVNVWRDWRSEDGQYFLTLRTGVWDPNGNLFFLKHKNSRGIEGYQKGKNLALASFNPEFGLNAPPEYRLSGSLDVQTNTFNASIEDVGAQTKQDILFSPAILVRNRPLLRFVFYGFQDKDWHQNYITQIDVIDQKTNRTIQQLKGFTAQGYMVDYMDVNYDGYFDLVMHMGTKVGDPQYRYYLYQPSTRQFEQNKQFSLMSGYPTRYPHKQQIHFQEGLFRIENNHWQRIPCCHADDE